MAMELRSIAAVDDGDVRGHEQQAAEVLAHVDATAQARTGLLLPTQGADDVAVDAPRRAVLTSVHGEQVPAAGPNRTSHVGGVPGDPPNVPGWGEGMRRVSLSSGPFENCG